MCLSNCSKCKYFDRTPHHSGDIVCSLNPAYASSRIPLRLTATRGRSSMWKRLKSLDEYSLACLPIDDCLEFELDPAFKEKAITLSLSFFDWQKLEQETSNSMIGNALRDTIIGLNLSLTQEEWQEIANSTAIPAVRVALEAEGIEAKRDPWICVDSSCIDAIAYLTAESILKIRFNSGLVYQYDRVAENVFLNLCDAYSKGHFFNHNIKDCYQYQLI